MNRTVADVVGELFRDRLRTPQLDPDVPLLDYGLDSVRAIELVVDMEQRFGVEISDEDASTMLTLSDVVEWLTRRVGSAAV